MVARRSSCGASWQRTRQSRLTLICSFCARRLGRPVLARHSILTFMPEDVLQGEDAGDISICVCVCECVCAPNRTMCAHLFLLWCCVLVCIGWQLPLYPVQTMLVRDSDAAGRMVWLLERSCSINREGRSLHVLPLQSFEFFGSAQTLGIYEGTQTLGAGRAGLCRRLIRLINMSIFPLQRKGKVGGAICLA